ncbi:protein phosphatase inhibitor 2 isoform X1 [Neodiprion pinetum]|uniref:Protein phosphatase inhibitor 2 isoform X1 n=1 Tax=Neodiprion lecontei TaxID=441921 RepID=A0A6J0C6S7_NEOLC|nr:protein phosphatase inhibitor 2 isoform X1 [Neodiprion lecontei]XP_046410996.1 protein phosphatase inhibitor 2-like isoform X1 [Neodiprion fabricii]XP_046465678.1 protein phosphatase inhibitor 2 isoform X1 [Neodiprion pinetum]XP_046605369.1 protein phosphatase inhibitor 2 isoform X1 [Neodiprion virginianus]
MAENLGKRPSKGILKSSSSFDSQEAPSRPSKETKWDEMNIIATLHPADKDYGHMKIDEPKTPYNYEGVDNEHERDQLDSSIIAAKLAGNDKPKILEESSDEEDEETPEERQKRLAFEQKRKGHYQEWQAVQLARKSMQEESDEDSDEEDEADSNSRSKCVPSCDSEPDSDSNSPQ